MAEEQGEKSRPNYAHFNDQDFATAVEAREYEIEKLRTRIAELEWEVQLLRHNWTDMRLRNA